MKKIITLLVLMCSLSVVAQEYTPLVREGVKWECVSEQIGWGDENKTPYKIYFDGDSVMEDITYKKCYIETESSKKIVALMREDIDSKKVYIRYGTFPTDVRYNTPIIDGLDGVDADDEYLLYDFSDISNSDIIKMASNNSGGYLAGAQIVKSTMLVGDKISNRSQVFDSTKKPLYSIVEGVGFIPEFSTTVSIGVEQTLFEGTMLDFLFYDSDTDGWTNFSYFNRLVADDGTVLYESPNTYTPLVREGVKWECVLDVWKPQNEVGPNYFHYPYTISFDGDTIINGKNYKKCFYQFADNDVATSDIPRAFVREDLADRKVYCIDNLDFQYYVAAPATYNDIYTPDGEYLLYDFANPVSKEQSWYYYDYTDIVSSVVEVGDKKLNKYEVIGLSLIESIGYAGNGNDYENYCFHGDLLIPMIAYMPCLCETSYPTFRRFVDENDNTIFSVSRFEADENYTPLVREGIKWNCVMHKTYSAPTSPEEHDVHSFYSIKFDGDTIINGITYKKCFYVFEDANEPSNIIPRAFVREDVLNKKVYVIYNGNYTCDKGMVAMPVENDTEYLLYDFEDVANNDQIWCNDDIEYFTRYYPKVGNDYCRGFRINGFDGIAYAAGIGVTGNVMAQYADLLTQANEYVETGGVYIHPQFLNMEDAEGNIIYTASEFNQVEGIATDNNATETTRYDLYGRRLNRPTQGVNIIKMSDGSTRKEIVK